MFLLSLDYNKCQWTNILGAKRTKIVPHDFAATWPYKFVANSTGNTDLIGKPLSLLRQSSSFCLIGISDGASKELATITSILPSMEFEFVCSNRTSTQHRPRTKMSHFDGQINTKHIFGLISSPTAFMFETALISCCYNF